MAGSKEREIPLIGGIPAYATLRRASEERNRKGVFVYASRLALYEHARMPVKYADLNQSEEGEKWFFQGGRS